MIKTIRGDIQLGISVQAGSPIPQTEEEIHEAIRSEMGADLLVILHAMADALDGKAEAMEVYVESADLFVKGE